ncbi:MAG: acyl-homoserine-lactone synthase [Notoacmeibacter sp.]
MHQVLITDNNVSQHQALIEQCYQFRHKFFVDGLKWEDLRRADCRDVDQFDVPGIVHVVGVDQGEVFSYSRFLPTTRPHLLDTIYPQLLEGNPEPVGETIWEWTRCAVDPKRREGRKAADPATSGMTLGVIEACLTLGIEALHVQTHPMLLTRMMELGFKCKPLALPSQLDGQDVIPFLAHVSEVTLQTARQVLGVKSAVLQTNNPVFEIVVPRSSSLPIAEAG